MDLTTFTDAGLHDLSARITGLQDVGDVKIYNRKTGADTEGMIWNSTLTALPFY